MKKIPPNKYRHKNLGPWSSEDEDGFNGAFTIPLQKQVLANCIVSDGTGVEQFGLPLWEHVSVHIVDHGKERTPSWKEMNQIKDIFWEEDECVVQFHPPKKDYVNNHPHVLHLWRWKEGDFPRPPSQYVGIKDLGVIP